MTPMPLDMKMLSQYVTAALGWPGFQPEAAIVNFYHQGSTLSGHTDHSELDHQSPLLSVRYMLKAKGIILIETVNQIYYKVL